MSGEEISFGLIPEDMSADLCQEFQLERGDLFSEYRSQPSIQIPNTTAPNVCGEVIGDGNCLYRAICLAISGSETSYNQLRQMTALELNINRRNFANIPEDTIQELIDSALTDGDWGQESHIIALSLALRIRIYVFNRIRQPSRWDPIFITFKPNCDFDQVDCLYKSNCSIIYV